MWRFAESRLAWFGATAAALAAFVVATALLDTRTRTLVDEGMKMHAIATAAAWQAESRTARCPRTPLREPTTGDGSRYLEPLVDKSSVEVACLSQLGDVASLYACEGSWPCKPVKVLGMQEHPDLVAKCAALYDDIGKVAHASDACSPMRAGTYDVMGHWDPPVFRVAEAVRLQIVPLVRRGDLGGAARRVTDAIRFAQDLGRHTSFLGAMWGSAIVGQLLATLDEILVDPRLTRDEARAIAHDLDILRATMPTFAETVHGEAAAFPSMLRSPGTGNITGDAGQDLTLWMLGKERSLEEFDRTCGATSLRTCAALELATPYDEDWWDFDPLIRNFDDDATVRERVIDRISSQWSLSPYARGFERRHVTLLARRMQAELRMMDDCRFDRLAPWLEDGVTIDAGGVVQPPAWSREPEAHYPAPGQLSCVPR